MIFGVSGLDLVEVTQSGHMLNELLYIKRNTFESDYYKRKRTRTANDRTHPKPGSVQNVILVNYCVTDPQPITHRNTDWAAASLSQAPVSLFHVLSPGISSKAQLVIILNINEHNLH